jgi:hypothetical protein
VPRKYSSHSVAAQKEVHAMVDIPQNFEYKEFDSEQEAKDFASRYGFEYESRRSDYEIWGTKGTTKRRANI